MKKLLFFIAIILSVNWGHAVDYSQFDVNDINAANKAVKAYHEEFKDKKGTKEADNEYENFWNFYADFVYTQATKTYLPYTTVNSSISKQIKIYSEQYYKYGLIAQFNEGEYLLSNSRKYIYKNFGNYVSKEKQELLKFDIQFDKRIIYDMRYVVPKSQLRYYIKFYKKFVKKYPEYSKTHNINEFIEIYEKRLQNYPNLL